MRRARAPRSPERLLAKSFPWRRFRPRHLARFSDWLRPCRLEKLTIWYAPPASSSCATRPASNSAARSCCSTSRPIRSRHAIACKSIVTSPAAGEEGPRPAVVCIGGHGSDLYSPYDETTVPRDSARVKADRIYRGFGTALTARGYVTISTTVSQHEVREKDRSLMGERLWDLIRCVDYLESLPNVDVSRIGCAGLIAVLCISPERARSNQIHARVVSRVCYTCSPSLSEGLRFGPVIKPFCTRS